MLSRRLVVPSLLCACVLLLASGCTGQRPENSPYIKSKFAELDEQLKDVAKVKRDITLLQDDIKYFAEELTAVRTVATGMTPEQTEAIAKLSARAAEFDKVLADLAAAQARIVELEKSVSTVRAASNARPAAPATATPTRTVTSTSNPAPAKPARVAASTATGRPSTSAATPTQRSRSGGFYYNVKSADSLTSVAKAHNVAVRDLARANNLPENASLAIGQRLWVP